MRELKDDLTCDGAQFMRNLWTSWTGQNQEISENGQEEYFHSGL